MKRLEQYIECKQTEFAAHAFFQRLERRPPLGEIVPFASKLTFWVMTFQDLLQINARRFASPELARIARQHMAEDAGHDRWFLTDLLAIDGGHPDLGKLFSKEHAAVRHLSYGLLSEVYRPQADEERLVFLLALESSSHVFFERVVRYFRDSGVRKALKYFGDAHLDAENAHEMFEESLEAALAAARLSEEQHAQCLQLVDRSFAAFQAIFDEIENTLMDRAGGDVEERGAVLRAAERQAAIL
jgi:hypothetical protein